MELSEAEKEDYKSVKTQMITRMALVRFVSLEDFKGRRLLPSEPLSVFLHVLKQLLELRQMHLLIHQFLTGLPTHVSRQLWAAGEINDLDKVLGRALLKKKGKQQLPLTQQYQQK